MMQAAVDPRETLDANLKPPQSVKLDEESKKELEKKNPIPGPHHPTYLTMIKGAVLTLNEGKGASKTAILKYLAQHYPLGENLPKINSHLCSALRKGTKDGDIEQMKGTGASGSFKTSSGLKNTKKSVDVKKPVMKKPRTPAKKPVTNTQAKSKPTAKKPAVKKGAPKLKANAPKPAVAAPVTKKKPVGRPRVQKKRGQSKTKAPRAKRT